MLPSYQRCDARCKPWHHGRSRRAPGRRPTRRHAASQVAARGSAPDAVRVTGPPRHTTPPRNRPIQLLLDLVNAWPGRGATRQPQRSRASRLPHLPRCGARRRVQRPQAAPHAAPGQRRPCARRCARAPQRAPAAAERAAAGPPRGAAADRREAHPRPLCRRRSRREVHDAHTRGGVPARRMEARDKIRGGADFGEVVAQSAMRPAQRRAAARSAPWSAPTSCRPRRRGVRARHPAAQRRRGDPLWLPRDLQDGIALPPRERASRPRPLCPPERSLASWATLATAPRGPRPATALAGRAQGGCVPGGGAA